ncbi:MAG TPA: tRNA (adenosine(37)-N6)-threonylcarbamoyltransferase complex ATPase subunit type 1 TsaE [Parvularculaceae bacterium]|nr:tRNA (adenosine(37)-N6)-threonylcarbamoyltransferase complex ATPase subunit type 1 TsaE [Parvularculaceae bacterium]HNS87822.1 tRNA (adenosine(37)-N6)-threonylcarbamoyltransferase complex ATPase subunit type 1 TsaE [Parvularculaceae bacterium]
MIELTFPLENEAATARLGSALADRLAAGDVIALSGPLGAGKTTLARAVVKALAGRDEAPSPTFTLVETYETPTFTLHHFDLYRLEKAEEVWELGFEDALDGVSLIEWPERIEALLPNETLLVSLSMDGDARRALIRGGDEWAGRLEGFNPA